MTNGNKSGNELSPQQQQTLRVIAAWGGTTPPRAGSLVTPLNLSNESAVRARLRPLEANGYIARGELGPGLPRFISLTEKGLKAIGFFERAPRVMELRPNPQTPLQQVPLPCGPLGETVGEVSYISHPFSNWISGDYIVTAEGDSMWDAQHSTGIPPNAKVQMRPDVAPQSGDVCHVEFIREDELHECTMKAFFLDEAKGLVTLRPFNPAYPKIVLPGERVEIKGVAQDVVLPAKSFLKWGRK